MEKVVRELRAIVFQGRDTGPPGSGPARRHRHSAGLDLRPAERRSGRLFPSSTANWRLCVTISTTRASRPPISRPPMRFCRPRLRRLRRPRSRRARRRPPGPDPAPIRRPKLRPASSMAPRPPFGAAISPRPNRRCATMSIITATARAVPEARFYLAKALMARHEWADAATAEIGAVRGWPKNAVGSGGCGRPLTGSRGAEEAGRCLSGPGRTGASLSQGQPRGDPRRRRPADPS